MRQNAIIALLSICCTLLAVNLMVALRKDSSLPLAFGQAVGTPSGQVVLATGQSQGGSDAVLYLYDVGTQTLGCYSTKNQGIELKGVRSLKYDLQAQEYVARGKSPSVAEMKKAVGGGGASKGGDDKDKKE